MPYRSRTVLLLFAALGLSAQANAQVSSSASATTTVVDPAVITKHSDLDFGHIEADGTARTVVISPNETSGPGGNQDNGAGASPATIKVEGASDQSYSIGLPQKAHTLAHQNGNDTVKVKDFTSDIPDGLLLSGSQTIRIGATLSIEEGQAAGLYVSQAGIPVTVNYN